MKLAEMTYEEFRQAHDQDRILLNVTETTHSGWFDVLFIVACCLAVAWGTGHL